MNSLIGESPVRRAAMLSRVARDMGAAEMKRGGRCAWTTLSIDWRVSRSAVLAVVAGDTGPGSSVRAGDFQDSAVDDPVGAALQQRRGRVARVTGGSSGGKD